MNKEKRATELKQRIKSLTEEINQCASELASLLEDDLQSTGATEEDMDVQSQLASLVDDKG